MKDSERQALILELNRLSEFEEQNLERMKEIAHVLVADYLHRDGKEQGYKKSISGAGDRKADKGK